MISEPYSLRRPSRGSELANPRLDQNFMKKFNETNSDEMLKGYNITHYLSYLNLGLRSNIRF